MKKGIKVVAVAALLLAAGTLAVAQRFLSNADAALFRAAEYGTAKDVRAAIERGANVNARQDPFGTTVLMAAAQYSRKPDVLWVLILAGADVNARDNYGRTALMYAREFNPNHDMRKVLIDAGGEL